MIPFGKRVKSSKNETLFIGFPGSDQIKILPAGKPSPVIDSFIQGRFYQFVSGGQNLYMEKNEFQTVVDPDARDESAIGSGLITGVQSAVGNQINTVSKWAGFIGDGFTQSVSGVGLGFESLGADIKKALTVGAFLSVIGLTIYLVIKTK